MHTRIAVTKWLKCIRDAVLMGLTWAVIWAPIGVLTGLIVDPDGSMDEMWVAVGGYPGFLCGAVFSAVLRVSKGRSRFEELSLSQAGAKGAVSGVLVGAIPFGALASDGTGGLRGWPLGVLIIATLALLSVVSACGSLALAKGWRRKNGSMPMQE